jgi:hypothetical protein
MGNEGWNTTLRPPSSPGSARTIEIVSLDDVLEAEPDFRDARILKIDAEGYDLRILRGASSFLEHARPTLIFEYNRGNLDPLGDDGLSIFVYLRERGYDALLLYDPYGRLVLSCSTADTSLLEDLHAYANGRSGRVAYFDIVAFHAERSLLSRSFIGAERTRQAKISSAAQP